MGIYVEEPLTGSKQTTRVLNHGCCFIVMYKVNKEQRAQEKLLVHSVNSILNSS